MRQFSTHQQQASGQNYKTSIILKSEHLRRSCYETRIRLIRGDKCCIQGVKELELDLSLTHIDQTSRVEGQSRLVLHHLFWLNCCHSMTNKDGYEFTHSTCNALTSFDQSLTNINPNIE